MSFMRGSVVSLRLLVVFLRFSAVFLPAKLLNYSGFVLIPTHLFRTFAGSKPHFFLFSKRGNVTHNTHNIYNFAENQALDSQQTHNKTPTHSQHLTTLPRVTRKCCELLWVVVPFFVKITPPLTLSSSEPLVENVVSVVSVVSQNRILRKNRYLFLPSRSPIFFLLKVPFPSSPIPLPVL